MVGDYFMALEMTVENMMPAFMAGVGLLFIAFMGLILYVYTSVTMMFTAMKLKTKNAWLAWIPIANLVLMANMAKKHWWPVLLLLTFFIPVLNVFSLLLFFVFVMIWFWRITEFRGMPGWLVLFTLLPAVGNLWGLILWGMLAWAPVKKKDNKAKPVAKRPAKKATVKKRPAKTAKKKVAKKRVTKKK